MWFGGKISLGNVILGPNSLFRIIFQISTGRAVKGELKSWLGITSESFHIAY